MLKKKKKTGNFGGVLGALVVGVGVAAAALLSDKKTRNKVKKAVSDVTKKATSSAKKVTKEVSKEAKVVAKKGGESVKKVKVVRKAPVKK